jgi:L-ascorbate metabolism protein UlaG (beta-lactamase superfamily)
MIKDVISPVQSRYKAGAEKWYKQHYSETWRFIFDTLPGPVDECLVWIAGPSFYILSLNGVCIAIDPVFRFPWIEEMVDENILKDFSKINCVLLSHEHKDHLDYSLMRKLSSLPIRWVIPSFFGRQCIFETGIKEDQICWQDNGNHLSFRRVGITSFKSPHNRKGCPEDTPPEHGYFIETENRKLLFPVDIRSYDPSRIPSFGPLDALFMHIWLGGGNALNLPCEPYLSEFCDFVASLKCKRVFLAHLYELGRPVNDLWTLTHAGLVMDELLAKETDQTTVMKIGQMYKL